MMIGLLHLHNLLRWVILILLVWAWINSLKNKNGKETEYILSFRIKKEILQKCNQILVNPPTNASDINKLGYCITILNQYRFYDPILENITLHFMKQVQKPEELLKRLKGKNLI